MAAAAGAVALSRTGDPASGEFEDAVVNQVDAAYVAHHGRVEIL